MALVELMNRDILKACISQNIDGLHRKSGMHPSKLADLHGNTNLEVCIKCNREHMRDFKVRTAVKGKEHKTGRKCDTPGCNGDLKDTIINFGESLDGDILTKGFAECAKSDLVVAMGSSMRVNPACSMPLTTLVSGGKFVMINLQATQADGVASLVIHERVDKVIELLMQKLEIPIPEYRRSYRLKVSLDPKDSKKVLFTGVDSNGACYTLFKSLKVSGLGNAVAQFPAPRQNIQPFAHQMGNGAAPAQFSIECTFQGHYNEPKLTLKVPMDKLKSEKALEFDMIFHVKEVKFQQVKIVNSESRAELGTASYTTVAAPRAPAQAPAAARNA